MFHYERKILIERPVAEVFEYVTRPEAIPEWASVIESVERTTPGSLRKGSKFIEYPNLPLFTPQVRWEVVDFEPPELCVFTGRSFLGRTWVNFTCQENDGGTLLTVRVAGELSMPFRLFEPVIARGGAKDREDLLQRIKDLMETSVPELDQ